ncbi:hypothetical protein [uncultured Marinobacter sp.]|nr:hypothetical protein [uncultured Marinobacter sp.]
MQQPGGVDQPVNASETDWLLKDIQSGKDSLMALSDEHWVA